MQTNWTGPRRCMRLQSQSPSVAPATHKKQQAGPALQSRVCTCGVGSRCSISVAHASNSASLALLAASSRSTSTDPYLQHSTSSGREINLISTASRANSRLQKSMQHKNKSVGAGAAI
jgi:hypothetical protein